VGGVGAGENAKKKKKEPKKTQTKVRPARNILQRLPGIPWIFGKEKGSEGGEAKGVPTKPQDLPVKEKDRAKRSVRKH